MLRYEILHFYYLWDFVTIFIHSVRIIQCHWFFGSSFLNLSHVRIRIFVPRMVLFGMLPWNLRWILPIYDPLIEGNLPFPFLLVLLRAHNNWAFTWGVLLLAIISFINIIRHNWLFLTLARYIFHKLYLLKSIIPCIALLLLESVFGWEVLHDRHFFTISMV